MGGRRTCGYTVRNPKVGPGPPRVQPGPLEWDPKPPPPPGMGSGPPTMGSQDRTYTGLEQDPGGGPVPTRVQAQFGADLFAYASAPRPSRDPMLPRGLLHVT
jgi:hypothetical protein